jgi:hypothetical protein
MIEKFGNCFRGTQVVRITGKCFGISVTLPFCFAKEVPIKL